MRDLKIIRKRKLWYTISLLMIVIGLASVMVFGFKYGLDFTGGSLIEIQYAKDRPSNQVISDILATKNFSAPKVQPSGDTDVIIRLQEISEAQHQLLLSSLTEQAQKDNPENSIIEKRFESFGSTLGAELRRNSIYAILFVLVAIILYLAYAFRKVTHPVASWKFGTVAVIALAHDVLVVLGLFSILGYLYNTEIDSLFITALLTLLGFSVHDTIVTLDRVRENIFKKQDLTFEEVVNASINETITRSINTSATTLFALIAIYFFGGSTVKDFSLALIAGIVVGTYSSIFIAAPLLVTWYNFSRRKG